MKKISYLAGMALLFLLISCPVKGPGGDLFFPFNEELTKDELQSLRIAGFTNAISFGIVKAGETGRIQFPIKNTGEQNLEIYNMDFYDREFGFAPETRPDFPIIVAPGKEVNDIYLAFSPLTNGDFSSMLSIRSSAGDYRVNLQGQGAWVLTIQTHRSGNLAIMGDVIEPVFVEDRSAVEGTFITVSGVVEIAAKPGDFNNFVSWYSDIGSPTFAEASDTRTTVTLKDHSRIYPGFYNDVLVVTDENTLRAALLAFTVGIHKGIAFRVGNYDLDDATYTIGNLELKEGMNLYGGYAATGTDRAYLTEDNRNNGTYSTVINLNGYRIIASGVEIDKRARIEGFTIRDNVSVSGTSPMIDISDEANIIINNNTFRTPTGGRQAKIISVNQANPTIQDNVFSGNTPEPVIYLEKASPQIKGNDIRLGTASAEVIGIHAYNYSMPTISGNTISGGATTANNGRLSGIYAEFSSEVTVLDNRIDMGASTGPNGLSYGIYIRDDSEADIGRNHINGGSSSWRSFAIYLTYGGRPDIYKNDLYTTAGEGEEGYGFFFGCMSRFRSFQNNNIYDCDTALAWLYLKQEKLNDINEVNDFFGPFNILIQLGDDPGEPNISDPARAVWKEE